MKKFIYSISTILVLAIIGLGIGMNHEDNPVNYGHTSDPVLPKRQKRACCQKVNREGLDQLNVHASGFINFNEGKTILKNGI